MILLQRLVALYHPIRTAAAIRTTLPRSMSNNNNNNVIYDLYRGHPNMDMLPQPEMKQIMAALLKEEDDDGKDSWRKYLNYGANEGDHRLIDALRSFLRVRTVDDDLGDTTGVDEDYSNTADFFITTGVSHGLELLCSTLTSPGDEIWIERPTYFLCTKIFTNHGLTVKSLPMLQPGKIDIDHLVQMVERDGIQPPKMMYVIPSYHNPCGTSMSLEERKKLTSFAVKHNVLVVCDEVYHLLDFERGSISSRRPAGMVRFNKFALRMDQGGQETDDNILRGCCISVSSFTKIFAPGVRLGWIEAPPFVIKRLARYGYINSQGGNAPFMGRIISHALESGLLDTYLDKLRLEYKGRHEMMCQILQRDPRLDIYSINEPRGGGYFIWVGLGGVDANDFLSYSLDHFGVKFMAGQRCNPLPDEDDATSAAIRSCARLCFADLNRDDLRKGAETFVKAYQSYVLTIEA